MFLVSNYTGGLPLLEYFDRTYISGVRVAQAAGGLNMNIGIKRPPQFPPATWSVHEATLNGMERTNNQTEGWNHR